MFESKRFRANASIRAAAFTTLLAFTASSAAQAALTRRPLVRLTAAQSAAMQSAAVQHKARMTTFTTIDDPADPTFNQLLGIDNNGVISGYFGIGAPGHPNQGYTIARPYNVFQPDNLPGSVQTQATGIINHGTTTGFWSPTENGNGTDTNYGFIRIVVGGATLYLSVNDPLVVAAHPVNQVLGINSSLNAVGFYNDAAANSHGFVYSVRTGNFTPLAIPGAVSDAATGINEKNLVSGFFSPGGGQNTAFLAPLSGGPSVHFAFPGSFITQFLGVNAYGVAVGFYNDAAGIPHGLVYNSSNGTFKVVDDPLGALGTTLNGINDRNEAVGFYVDAAGNTHGMLVRGLEKNLR